MISGRRIGPFLLGEILSEGQDARLYQAQRTHTSSPSQPVCIRVAHDPLDPAVCSAIRHEYEVLSAMDNPRIPKAYGHYPSEAAVAIAHHPGVSLSAVIAARNEGLVQMGIGTAIDLIVEVAHALRHANSILNLEGGRIVHGQLNSDNVCLRPDGSVIVLGFGEAAHRRQPAYTAPEVAHGAPPTPASDQWSLGVLLVELILGEPVYTGVGDEVLAAREGDVAHWQMAATHAHPALEELLRGMLAQDPSLRFQHGHELLKSLLAAGRKVGGTVNRRSLTTSVFSHAKRKREMTPPPVRHTEKAAEKLAQAEPTLPDDFGIDFEEPAPNTLDLPSTLKPTPPAPVFTFGPNAENAPPAPEPAPRLLPSEFAGIALGGLMMFLGLTYVFWVL